MTAAAFTHAYCAICNTHAYCAPLHGDGGGPLCCLTCVGKWHAEHGRRRRAGRVVIRAIKAFLDAGGKSADVEKLKTSATMSDFMGVDLSSVLGADIVDQLGYMDGSAKLDGAGDLTSELLADSLRLTHPDCHPPERQELAHRVTQGLLALQPFCFPAPKPKPSEPASAKPKARSEKADPPDSEKQSRYPCGDCADAIPYHYCNACRAEWEKRERAKSERQRAKQRAAYARRRQWQLRSRQKVIASQSPCHR
jgi:hypothetical protein